MVKLKGPGLSEDAAGKLADVLIFAHSKRRHYAKKHAAPTNPRSGAQVGVRAAAAWIAQQWKQLSPAHQLTWTHSAKALSIKPYHAYLKTNLIRWAHFRTPTKEDPAAETSTPPPAPQTACAVDGQRVKVYVLATIPPTGWAAFLMRDTSMPGFKQRNLVIGFPVPTAPGAYSLYYDYPGSGHWYYRSTSFNADGVQGPMGAGDTAIVP